MRAHHTLLAILALACSAGLAFGVAPPRYGGVLRDHYSPRLATPAATATPPYRVSGPVTHENMAVFFLHGLDQAKGRPFLTLDEALQQKKAVVHETKNVNELAIENVSGKESVFIQAGDIVKGGHQDRTIAVDLVVPPKSARVPLPSYCVEQGRWSKRGTEDSTRFACSNDNLVGNSLKLAVRKAAAQGEVWSYVASAQRQLNDQLKSEVRSKTSTTSLALTLENKKLLEAVDGYVKKLQPALDKQADVLGYAVAINGKMNNADVYASAELFRKLWPKLLKASAVEAVVARQPAVKIAPVAVKTEAVTAFLIQAQTGKKSERLINKMVKELRLEGKDNVLYETREAGKGPILRRSYLAK
jgi:hypothetical protein